jgi:hypothetical protein
VCFRESKTTKKKSYEQQASECCRSCFRVRAIEASTIK